VIKISLSIYLNHPKLVLVGGNLCNKTEMNMSTTTTNQTFSTKRISVNYTEQASITTSAWSRFINWCKGQQENRLLWLGIALAGHGCVLTPLTVVAVLLDGASFPLMMLAIIAMGMALVTNLAALPTKITIPVFLLSIIIDIAIVVASLSIGFDITKSYF
jgi:hypothetical protein